MPTAERCGEARRRGRTPACSRPPPLPPQAVASAPSASALQPCPLSLPPVDSEASQAAESGGAVEAAAERVPPRRVLAALGLRVLAPARLRGPHLLGAQHPQEALAAGRDHSGRDRGVPADGGELITRRQCLFFFLMELSGPFFKHQIRHEDVEDITLVTNDLGWTIKQQQSQECLFKKSCYSTV